MLLPIRAGAVRHCRMRAASAALLFAALLAAGCSETPTGTGAKPGEGGKSGSAKASKGAGAAVDPDKSDEKPDVAATNGTKTAAPVAIELAGPEDLQAKLDAFAKDGKVVLVDFWGTWCAPCKKNFPHTLAMLQDHAAEGLAVITVAVEFEGEKGQPEAVKFLTEQKADKSINLLSRFSLDEADKFGVGEGFPEYRVYGRDGKLVKRFESGKPDEPFDHTDVEATVKEALKAKDGAAP
jgi:thiol-disulfide isomerase/thioredoxin